MPLLPSLEVLVTAFGRPQKSQLHDPEPSVPSSAVTTATSRRPIFPAWSAVDDVRKTVSHDIEVAQARVHDRTGDIELYSPKYYASCTIGGILACVSGSRNGQSGMMSGD